MHTLKHKLDDTIPMWFDLSLYDIYQKKRDRSTIRKSDRSLDAILRAGINCLPSRITHISKHNNSWLDIEQMIREICVGIKEDNYNPDVIIGIKSGGAFIARYVAICLEAPVVVGYMRVSHYSGKTRSVVKSFTEVKKEAVVTEPNKLPVKSLKVLLVDDQTATGSSLEVGKKHLIEQGAMDVRRFCLFSNESEHADYYRQRGLAMYFPWGKDA